MDLHRQVIEWTQIHNLTHFPLYVCVGGQDGGWYHKITECPKNGQTIKGEEPHMRLSL